MGVGSWVTAGSTARARVPAEGCVFRSHLSDPIAREELAFVPVRDGEALLAVVQGVDVTQTDRLVEDDALFRGEQRHGRAIVGSVDSLAGLGLNRRGRGPCVTRPVTG